MFREHFFVVFTGYKSYKKLGYKTINSQNLLLLWDVVVKVVVVTGVFRLSFEHSKRGGGYQN